MANEQNLKPFKPGQSGNPAGRPKNRFAHIKELYELSSTDIDDLIKYALSLNVNELKTIINDPNTPAVQVAVFRAIIDGSKQGNLYNIYQLLDRVFGAVKQPVEVSGGLEVSININATKPANG
jgi:hypothetical protein